AAVAMFIAVLLIAIAWILSIVIRFALSRKREYLADAGSVELTQNPDAMISALRKIEGRGELPGAASAGLGKCISQTRRGVFLHCPRPAPPVRSAGGAAGKFRPGPRPGPAGVAGAEQTEARQNGGGGPPRPRRAVGRIAPARG